MNEVKLAPEPTRTLYIYELVGPKNAQEWLELTSMNLKDPKRALARARAMTGIDTQKRLEMHRKAMGHERAMQREFDGERFGRVLAMPLRQLFPECDLLIKDSPQLHPLICLRGTCHRNKACMVTLANRVRAVFDAFPRSTTLLLYFRYRHRDEEADDPSIGAGLFRRTFDVPRLIGHRQGYVLSRNGWKVLRTRSRVFRWDPPAELFLPPPEKKRELVMIAPASMAQGAKG